MSCISFLVVFFIFFLAVSDAGVPKDRTFRAVNEGEFIVEYPTEYNSDARFANVPGSPNQMFNLIWHNTTPGEFYLGLRMGITRSDSPFRLVWDANRGKPVGENATLTFAADGDLVLAEADGRRVWSTGTANSGVVGFKILDIGNIVLYDKKGKFLWQSFQHPTDSLLVGQSLYAAGPRKLVSRRTPGENYEGAYSFELEPRDLNLYYTIAGRRLLYGNVYQPSSEGSLTVATFEVDRYRDTYDLTVSTNLAGTPLLAQVTFNATFSILRLETDGNLVVYSYYDPESARLWRKTYSYFVDGGNYPNMPACSLPSKCGALGVCEDGMCVACPTAKGLLGWSRSCAPPARVGPCRNGQVGKYYYKVVGVEQFIPVLNGGDGVAVKVEECMRRCSVDCDCKGFFYWQESSKCWLAPVLATLSKVDNISHVAYIKYFK